MKILTTSDLYYVTGGSDDGGGGGDGGSDGETCASSDKNACIAYCSSIALPTSDFGMAFARCMNSCYNLFSGSSSNYYTGEWAV
jgi:hypothetical protein